MSAGMGAILGPAFMRVARSAAVQASKVVRARLANAVRPLNAALEPALARIQPRQPIHPAALLRQQKSRRWHSTSARHNIDAALRRFMSTGCLESTARVDRTKFLGTKTGRAVAQFTGRTPFGSTLRPNLTGGALPRTAGGYGLGSGRMGGARYFSHTPTAQAQVVHNVSAAVRAFWISGQKAQFDGYNARGDAQFRAVSALQEETTRNLAAVSRTMPGSYIDFQLSPTVTALSPLVAAFPFAQAGVKSVHYDGASLNTEGFLDVLSVDFGRALKDLTATLADIKRLSALGDLPIQLEKGHILRVRFPGTDANTVESLCDDLGLTRGTVYEDFDFAGATGVDMALKFPFAPDAGQIRTPTSPGGSLRSQSGLPYEEDLYDDLDEFEDNPWLTSRSPEGYATMSPPISSGEHCSDEYEGFEGIQRFIQQLDGAKGLYR